MQPVNPLKAATLAALIFGTMSVNAVALESDEIHGWETPLAAEFYKLDTTGNGLILPNEASKAFTKKTFVMADADKDGTIDLAEYSNYKSGTQDYSVQPSNTAARQDLSDNPNMMSDNQTVADNADDANVQKRSVGVVIDDSVITTKVKAKILGTEDLKSLQISVQTRQGEVALSGVVDDAAAKMKAEEVVRSVVGVKSVRNDLEVKG